MKLHDIVPPIPEYVDDILRWFHHFEGNSYVLVWEDNRLRYAIRNLDGTPQRQLHAVNVAWAADARAHPQWTERAELIIR